MRLIAVSVLILVLALLMAEVAVRWTVGSPKAERLPLLSVLPDEKLGYRPIPRDEHYAYEQPVTLNDLGLRGRVPPRFKSPDHHRILVLGDSQVYGMGLAEEDLLTHQLERILAGQSNDRAVSVLNFGVRAYALNQQLDLLAISGLEFAPDVVALVVFRYSFYSRDIDDYYGRVQHRGSYMLDLDAKPEGLALVKWHLTQLLRRSALLSWLHDQVKAMRAKNSWVGDLKNGMTTSRVEARLHYMAKELDRFAELGRTHGFDPVLVVLPLPDQLGDVEPDRSYQSRLFELTLTRGIVMIDPLDSMRQARHGGETLFVSPFSSHFSAAAHRIVALDLARGLSSARDVRDP